MEVRIAGINIPVNKHAWVALTAIHGIGSTTARKICERANVEPSTVIKNLDEASIEAIRSAIDVPVEGELRREVRTNIKHKMDIGCYAGIRHRRGLPLKSRTRTNARTRKGKRKPIKA